MLWTFTCPGTLEKLFFAGGASVLAAGAIKTAKYFALLNTHMFLLVAIKTGGVWGQGVETLLRAPGEKVD